MLAIVLLLLIVAVAIGVFLAASIVLTVAFRQPTERKEVPDSEQTRLFLDRAFHLRTDPEDAQSPTFGQLMEQGHFDDLLEDSPLVCESLSRDA